LIVGIAFYTFYFASEKSKKDRGVLVPATILSAIGILFLVMAKFSYKLWPVILIAVGILIIFNRSTKDEKKDDQDKEGK
jgi:hypothetical protein